MATLASVPIVLQWVIATSICQGQTIEVEVDLSAERRPVSEDIFGVNFADTSRLASVPFSVNRRGGNSTTRYNWQVDVHNTASDWFFMNIPNAVDDVGALPSGSGADRFIAESLAGGSQPILTLPLIGWAPRPLREKLWGFSLLEYGPQDATECTVTGWVFWCQPDAGNGFLGGQKLTGNDPTDTSIPIGASWVGAWLDHLAGSGVEHFSMDNEPMLWSETHFDVHPQKVTYDELWGQTEAIAAMVKTKQPTAKVLGPAVWGWCAYFHSAADGCFPGADQAAHGGKPFLEWYLEQACAYEAEHGVRLIDYLDVHYYPQGGQALSGEGSAALQALRLRSLRDLFDPTYPAESWIPEAVRLIPRMQSMIDEHCPGTKLAITEYNWGEDCTTCALAQAEALAIFAREGVDLATRWGAPAEDSLDEDAFLLYLNYDAAGARVSGDSVRTTSSNFDAVGAYAIHASSDVLYLLLFNKSTSSRTVAVDGARPLGGNVEHYAFSGSQRLSDQGNIPAPGSPWTVPLSPRSANLLVVASPLAAGTLFEDGFELGTTASWDERSTP
jgi:hypothetical protein